MKKDYMKNSLWEDPTIKYHIEEKGFEYTPKRYEQIPWPFFVEKNSLGSKKIEEKEEIITVQEKQSVLELLKNIFKK